MNHLSVEEFLAELAATPKRAPHRLNAHAATIDALVAQQVSWVNITQYLNRNGISIKRQSLMEWHHKRHEKQSCAGGIPLSDAEKSNISGNRNITPSADLPSASELSTSESMAIQKSSSMHSSQMPSRQKLPVEPALCLSQEEKEKMIEEMRHNDMANAMSRVTGRRNSS
jgi:hypothetical protein